jgi:putative transposase
MDPLDLIETGKISRFFRATRKLDSPGIVSHITQRAAGKELLFLENADYLFMLWLLKEIAQNYSLKIYSFCLMPNHLHLLLSPEEKNLFDAMRDLFSRYAMKFNRKYQRKGHLFGGPYRQAVCFDNNYFLAASLYIHLNPVKASIVADPIQYRWSSIGLYCNENAPKSFVDPYPILNLISHREMDGRKKYQTLLKHGSDIDAEHVLEHEDAIARFGSKLAGLLPVLFKQVEQKEKITNPLGMNLLSLETLEKKIEEMKRDSVGNSPETRKAKKYLIEQLLARGFKKIEIAKRLGVSRKTVYNILKISI